MKRLMAAALAAFGTWAAAGAAEAEKPAIKAVLVHLGANMWCDWYPEGTDLGKVGKFPPDTQLGARAWAWSDYGWAHPEEFVARCPKSVVLSNWFYDEGDGGFDIGANAAPDRVRLSNFYLLKKAGYDQIPCASNYIGWKRREHGKGADDVIGRTVELGRRDLDNGHLLGFMMASWRVSRNRKHADCTLHGIDLMADALEGRIADPGTCDPKSEDF